MGLEISSEKEKQWIEGEYRRQKFYYALVMVTFLLMAYSRVSSIAGNIQLRASGRGFVFTFFAVLIFLFRANRPAERMETGEIE